MPQQFIMGWGQFIRPDIGVAEIPHHFQAGFQDETGYENFWFGHILMLSYEHDFCRVFPDIQPASNSGRRLDYPDSGCLDPSRGTGRSSGAVCQSLGECLKVAGREYCLEDFREVRLLGIGKASVAMSASLLKILGTRLGDGLVITKHTPKPYNLPFPILEGGHPVPDERSLWAGRKTLEFLSTLGPQHLLFCLISGGGSALVTTPKQGITLQDLQTLTSALLACGARIDEINCLRRRLELTKGGGVVRLSNGATIVSLILSDVIESPLEAIASGPTAPEPIAHEDVLALLEKYSLVDKLPVSILTTLSQHSDISAPDDPIFERVQNVIVGNGLQAAQAALVQAKAEGFQPYLLRVDMQGEARQAAFELATTLRQAKKTGEPVTSPACIVAGGETTVTLTGNGKGGRNTELALAAAIELADFPDVLMVSLATDGEDGPTDAAGAVVSGGTYSRAIRLGLSPDEYLACNNSYSFFSTLDDLLKPGPTGTNVNDLVFLFLL